MTTRTIGFEQNHSTVADYLDYCEEQGKDDYYGEMLDENFSEILSVAVSWAPDVDNGITLRANSSTAYDGTPGSGARIHGGPGAFYDIITVSEPYVILGGVGQGFEVENTSSRGVGITNPYDENLIDSLLIHGAGGADGNGIETVKSLTVQNCIVYNWGGEGLMVVTHYSPEIINSKFVDNGLYGINCPGSGAFISINNIFFNNASGTTTGNVDGDSGYNGGESGDSLPGSSNRTTVVSGDFDDYGNDKFILAAGASVIGYGVGPSDGTRGSYVPTTDINGTTRAGATCDIGADEFAAAGVTAKVAHSFPLGMRLGMEIRMP